MSIPTVNNQTNTNPPAPQHGVKLTQFILNGKTYEVWAVLETTPGKICTSLPLATIDKAASLVQDLLSAHFANGLENRTQASGIQTIQGNGVRLKNGTTESHEFTIETIKSHLSTEKITKFSQLATELGKNADLLKVQDIWIKIEELIKAAILTPPSQIPPQAPNHTN